MSTKRLSTQLYRVLLFSFLLEFRAEILFLKFITRARVTFFDVV